MYLLKIYSIDEDDVRTLIDETEHVTYADACRAQLRFTGLHYPSRHYDFLIVDERYEDNDIQEAV